MSYSGKEIWLNRLSLETMSYLNKILRTISLKLVTLLAVASSNQSTLFHRSVASQNLFMTSAPGFI